MIRVFVQAIKILPSCWYAVLYIKPCSLQLVVRQLLLNTQGLRKLFSPTWRHVDQLIWTTHVTATPCLVPILAHASPHGTEFCEPHLPIPTLLLPHTNNALKAQCVCGILLLLRHICSIRHTKHVQSKLYPRRCMLENHIQSLQHLFINTAGESCLK